MLSSKSHNLADFDRLKFLRYLVGNFDSIFIAEHGENHRNMVRMLAKVNFVEEL